MTYMIDISKNPSLTYRYPVTVCNQKEKDRAKADGYRWANLIPTTTSNRYFTATPNWFAVYDSEGDVKTVRIYRDDYSVTEVKEIVKELCKQLSV